MTPRIEDYALLGDLQTAALLSRDGRIDWLCLPRFDSPACFAALLHDPQAGMWELSAADGRVTRRAYAGETLIVDTEWEASGGTARVIDFMPPRGESAEVVPNVEGVSRRV